jgi:hypothetical protein
MTRRSGGIGNPSSEVAVARALAKDDGPATRLAEALGATQHLAEALKRERAAKGNRQEQGGEIRAEHPRQRLLPWPHAGGVDAVAEDPWCSRGSFRLAQPSVLALDRLMLGAV